MFGLFAPSCPLALDQKTWTEYRMRWLADKLGIERMRSAKVILPTEEFFPGPYEGSEDDVRSLFHRLKAIMGVIAPIDLAIGAATDMPDAGGLYLRGTPSKILIKETLLSDPYEVAATLVHELAHEILLGGDLLSTNEPDHEQVTDLLLIFLGVGIIPANNTVRDRSWSDGGMHYFQIRKSGYLSSADFGYAFALFAYVREEDNPAWATFLRPDALEVMKKGLRFLNKTGDSLFRSDTPHLPLRTPTALEACDQLREGTLTEQVFALWQLEKCPTLDRDVLEAVKTKAADRNWVVASAAANALGKSANADEQTVEVLIKGLNSHHPRVRAAAANSLGELRVNAERVVTALSNLLSFETNANVLVSAGSALGQFGSLARDRANVLLGAIDGVLNRNPSEAGIFNMVVALLAINPDAEQRIEEFYAEGNDEHRDHLLEIVEQIRDAATETEGDS